MSVGYVAVRWNRHKRVYDRILVAGIGLYVAVFFAVGKFVDTDGPSANDEVLLMRALGSCALLMLHVALCIGPLARLDPRFLPLLYNRRHLGVATFIVALGHGVLAIGYYHGFGSLNPLVSLLLSNTNYTSLSAFPFQTLGLSALVILFLMAATSHDFWLKNLSASTWKRLHMLVYPAYGLLVMHVVLGALQAQRSVWLATALVAGVLTVVTLHLFCGRRELVRDRRGLRMEARAVGRWIDVGSWDEIADQRAKVVCIAGGERIAVFRYDGSVSAITNVCAHQRGPLGEGKILDGCVTCPWHGRRFGPANGKSPPPSTEQIATYRVRVAGRRIFVDPQPLPPGTPVEPARIMEAVRG